MHRKLGLGRNGADEILSMANVNAVVARLQVLDAQRAVVQDVRPSVGHFAVGPAPQNVGRRFAADAAAELGTQPLQLGHVLGLLGEKGFHCAQRADQSERKLSPKNVGGNGEREKWAKAETRTVNREQGDLGAAVADNVVGQALVAALVALAGVVDQQIAPVDHSDPAKWVQKGHIRPIINGSGAAHKGTCREMAVKAASARRASVHLIFL